MTGNGMAVMLGLLTAHFVGDFLLQSDWMALNKSKRWDALTLHCAVYTLAVVAGMTPYVPLQPYDVVWHLAWTFSCVTFVTHFVTDAITSRVTAKLWFIDLEPARIPRQPYSNGQLWTFFARTKPTRHWFFVVIGADQLIHFWTLGLTWAWLTR